ncbi:hypothetical protein D3C75_1066810 [compost metagenome]
MRHLQRSAGRSDVGLCRMTEYAAQCQHDKARYVSIHGMPLDLCVNTVFDSTLRLGFGFVNTNLAGKM